MVMHGGRDERGFTLLEALVALLIVALGVEALISAAAAGLLAAHRERLTLEAIARAQSHLAELRDPAALAPLTRAGSDGGGFDYALRVTPLAALPPLRGLRLAGGVEPLATVLYRIDVVVSWRDGAAARSVSLAGQAIGAARP